MCSVLHDDAGLFVLLDVLDELDDVGMFHLCEEGGLVLLLFVFVAGFECEILLLRVVCEVDFSVLSSANVIDYFILGVFHINNETVNLIVQLPLN